MELVAVGFVKSCWSHFSFVVNPPHVLSPTGAFNHGFGPKAPGSPIINLSSEKKSTSPTWNNVTKRRRFERNQSSGRSRLHMYLKASMLRCKLPFNRSIWSWAFWLWSKSAKLFYFHLCGNASEHEKDSVFGESSVLAQDRKSGSPVVVSAAARSRQRRNATSNSSASLHETRNSSKLFSVYLGSCLLLCTFGTNIMSVVLSSFAFVPFYLIFTIGIFVCLSMLLDLSFIYLSPLLTSF